MLFAVMFEDDETMAHMRPQHMPAHLAFLEANAAAIRSAGPLRETIADIPAGGLWLVEAPDAAAVTDFIEADPFWPTGLRKSVRVLEWRRVFAEGQRLI